MMAVIKQMANDLYSQIGSLGAELASIEEQLEQLTAKRDTIKRQLGKLATQLAAELSGSTKFTASVAIARSDNGESDISPKILELLQEVKSHPNHNYGALAGALYEDDTPATRVALSTLIARAVAKGVLERSGRGKVKLTAKGVAAIGK